MIAEICFPFVLQLFFIKFHVIFVIIKGTVYSRVNRGLLRVYVAGAGMYLAVVYPGQEEEEESRGLYVPKT